LEIQDARSGWFKGMGLDLLGRKDCPEKDTIRPHLQVLFGHLALDVIFDNYRY
jgi:hypothetical protein